VRPLVLTLAGLRSYRAEQRVDLSDAGLLAVVGETGAGKSSLLEALCVALYGACTWDAKSVKPLIADGAETLRVSLTFTAEGRTWTATRAASRGPNPPPIHLLECHDDGRRWHQALAVNAQVRRLVGLDYHAFLRAVVLPQGRFQLLLQATGAERTAILKGIFRLDALGAVREQAAATAARLRPPLSALRARRALLPADPAVAAAGAAERLAAARAGRATLRAAADELAAATAAGAAARHAAERAGAAAALLDRALADAGDSAALLDGLAERERALAAERARRDAARATLRAREQELAAAAGDGDAAAARRALERLAAELPRLAAERARADAADAEAAARAADLAAGLVAAAAAEAAARDAAAALARDRAAHEAAVPAAAAAREAVAAARRAAAARAEAAAAVAAGVDEAAAATAAAERAAQAHARAAGALDAARREEAAAHAAAHAAPGEPCPICARPLPDGFAPPSAPALAAAEAARAAAAAADRAARDHAAAARAALAAADAALTRATATLTAATATADDLLPPVPAGGPAARAEEGDDLLPEAVPGDRAAGADAAVPDRPAGAGDAAERDRPAGAGDAAVPDRPAGAGDAAERDRPAARAAGAELAAGWDRRLAALEAGVEAAAGRRAGAERAADAAGAAAARAAAGVEADRLAGERLAAEAARLRAGADAAAARVAGDAAALPPDLRPPLPPAPATVAALLAEARRREEAAAAAARALAEVRAALSDLAETYRDLADRRRREVDDPLATTTRRLTVLDARARDALALPPPGAGAPPADAAPVVPEPPALAAAAAVAAWAGALAAVARQVRARCAGAAADATARVAGADAAARAALGRAGVADEGALRDALAAAAAGAARAAEDLAAAERDRPVAADLDDRIARVAPLADALDDLGALLTDGRFVGYLVARRQRALLAVASDLLGQMTAARFGFTEDFTVVDRLSGQARTTRTLSGGETFLASLALALALVELAGRGGGRLEALFLDEGFGSLDANALAEALDALGRQASGGRLVAVVSHLRAIAEGFEDVLHVTQTPTGSQARRLRGPELAGLLDEDARAGLLT